jgi:hypothetical protein
MNTAAFVAGWKRPPAITACAVATMTRRSAIRPDRNLGNSSCICHDGGCGRAAAMVSTMPNPTNRRDMPSSGLADTGFGVGLSPRVAAAVPRVVDAVMAEITARSFGGCEGAEMPWPMPGR